MNRINKISTGRNLLRLAILAALAVVVIATGLTNRASAGEPLVLREQIEVLADTVTLGDLFENAGKKERIAVFRSPNLGATGIVAARRIAMAAEQHALEWRNPGGIGKVVVKRPGRLISVDEMRKAIAGHVAGDGEKWLIDFNRGTKPFYIDSRVTSPLKVKQFDSPTDGGPFRAVLTAEHDRYAVAGETVTGHAFPSVEAIVPARPIKRGATISEDDIKRVDLPRARVSSSAIEDMKTAIGMAARQRLAVGRPIRREHLEPPKLVKRNSIVTITFAVPGMVLKAKGRALDDAARGERVNVENLQSKRTIEAEVTGTAAVAVTGLQPPVPAKRAAAAPADGFNSYVR